MDRPDEEFENYLRRFQLKTPRPLTQQMRPPHSLSPILLGPQQPRASVFRFGRWAAAAAVIVAAALTSAVLVQVFRVPSGPSIQIENSGNSPIYKNGQKIGAGQLVRSNSSHGLVLAFDDSSKVEMNSESELMIETANDGARIRLNNGSIIVEAATQKSGHLYVRTHDAEVSVVGTVFLVDTDSIGTRVAVMKGEVRVNHGGVWNTLRYSEQIATSPSMPLISIRDRILWSRNVLAYLTMLPQAPEVEASHPAAPSNAPLPALPPLPPLPQDSQTMVAPAARGGNDTDLERVCGTCHSASVAYSIVPNIDVTSIERMQAELSAEINKFKERGYKDEYPPLHAAETQIKQLQEQLASAKTSVSAEISKLHIGSQVSDQDLVAATEAIFRSRTTRFK
jgi:hypothetical protein